MQIYEVTKPPVQEGLLGDIGRGIVSAAGGPDIPQAPGDAAKDAAKSAAALTAKGYGPGGRALPSSNWTDKYKTIQRDPALQQYINSLMQAWGQQVTQQQQQQRKQSIAPPAQKTTQAQTQTQTKPTGYVPPTDPAEIADMKARGFDPETGEKIKPIFTPDNNKSTTPTKPVVRPKYGQMPADVASSEQGQRMIQAYGQPKGGIQKKMNEAPQEYTTPGGIVVPGGTRSDQTPGTPAKAATSQTDGYKQSFLKWSDSQLQSRDSRYNTITMSDVRKNVPGIQTALDKKLEDVVKARGTAQSAEAIKAYLEVAIAGVQARSQELKNTESQGSLAAASRASTQTGTVDQSLAQKGVNVNALKSFADTLKSKQARTTGNPEIDAMLNRMGVRVS